MRKFEENGRRTPLTTKMFFKNTKKQPMIIDATKRVQTTFGDR